MFSYIKGRLEYKYNDYVVVDVNGVGYKIFTSMSTIQAIDSLGETVKLFTHMYVREDIVCLYGFLTPEEIRMFELLISISGVGPKAAVSLMSCISTSQFGFAVITDDVKMLTKAQGIGNKTAQRIILELKDKIKKEQSMLGVGDNKTLISASQENSRISEAISALIVLGYTALEASKVVSAVYSDDLDLESIIKSSLKAMAKDS